MKRHPTNIKWAASPDDPTTSGSTRPQTVLTHLYKAHPEVGPAVEWLRDDGCNIDGAVSASLLKLAGRGRHLPPPRRLRYVLKVVANEFFRRWSKRHRGRHTVLCLQKNPAAAETELRPFLLMLMAAVDEKSFDRTLPKLARTTAAHRGGLDLGRADNFSCFVTTHGEVLAHRFLSNFDPFLAASANAVGYLEVTAVSHYLHGRTKAMVHGPNLARYLRTSKRLRRRTVVATKLAYLPALLTDGERRWLRERHDVRGSLVTRMKIKDVAVLLGYPSGNTLSRKLYRVRQWAGSATKGQGRASDEA